MATGPPISKPPLRLRVLVLEPDLDLLRLQARCAGFEAGMAAGRSPSSSSVSCFSWEKLGARGRLNPHLPPGHHWGPGQPGWEARAQVAPGEASRAPGRLGDPGWATAASLPPPSLPVHLQIRIPFLLGWFLALLFFFSISHFPPFFCSLSAPPSLFFSLYSSLPSPSFFSSPLSPLSLSVFGCFYFFLSCFLPFSFTF